MAIFGHMLGETLMERVRHFVGSEVGPEIGENPSNSSRITGATDEHDRRRAAAPAASGWPKRRPAPPTRVPVVLR